MKKIIIAIVIMTTFTMCQSIKYVGPANLENQKEFSEANLVELINELNIKEPAIVLAQAKLETGNFSSYIFLKSNNLFGENCWRGYRRYNSWQSSLLEYKKWQDKNYKGGDYYEFLYEYVSEEDSLYIQLLKAPKQ